MGKSNKPTKWFKAVKKAFRSPSRSPSKEKPGGQDDTKVHTDEKILSSHDLSSAPHQMPKPHPLPSFETVTAEHRQETEDTVTSQLSALEIAEPDVTIVDFPTEEEDEAEEEEAVERNNEVQPEEKEHDEGDYSYVSEEEEAALKIQQRFSGPMALKGLIRLQALVRGHQVRRQAATTLRAIEALVRFQARLRGHQVRMSKEGQIVQSKILRRRQLNSRTTKPGGGRWDASRGTLQDKNAKKSSRKEGVRKRERAMAYAFSQQEMSSKQSQIALKESKPLDGELQPFVQRSLRLVLAEGRTFIFRILGWSRGPFLQRITPFVDVLKNNTQNKRSLYIDCDHQQPHWGWTWLERWTISRPWEVHQLEDSKEFIEIIPSQKYSGYTTKEVDSSTLKVKNNGNVSSNSISSKSISTSPLTEKRETQFAVTQQAIRIPKALPVPPPSPPGGSPTTNSSHVISKPSPIQVSSHPAVEEDEDAPLEPRTPEGPKSPITEKSLSVPASPALSDDSLPVPPSPQGSDSFLPGAESPPTMGSGVGETSATMEGLHLSEAHEVNEEGTNGTDLYQSSNNPSLNGVHMEDSPSLKNSTSGNGHLEAGHGTPSNGEKIGENGDSPITPSVKPAKCRYMAATESAKAKFRSLSNPKTRSPDTTLESPLKQQTKRYSHGGKAESPKTINSTPQRISSFQARGSPSPKMKEKPQMDAGADSPIRRNSFGSSDGKSGVRWRS